MLWRTSPPDRSVKSRLSCNSSSFFKAPRANLGSKVRQVGQMRPLHRILESHEKASIHEICTFIGIWDDFYLTTKQAPTPAGICYSLPVGHSTPRANSHQYFHFFFVQRCSKHHHQSGQVQRMDPHFLNVFIVRKEGSIRGNDDWTIEGSQYWWCRKRGTIRSISFDCIFIEGLAKQLFVVLPGGGYWVERTELHPSVARADTSNNSQ